MRKLNVHKLVDALNELCMTLDDTYNVNSGGCCYLAYEIAKHLDRLNIKYRLLVANTYCIHESDINIEVRCKRKNSSETKSITGSNTCPLFHPSGWRW